MREIKFRAWVRSNPYDKNDVSMEMVFYPKWVTLEQDQTLAFIQENSSYVDDSDFRRDAHLMQFTGLKDKNGKEIYEGDIVQVFYKDKPQTEETKAYVVVIRNMMEDRFAGVGGGLGEVIGNIYENPELVIDMKTQ